MKKKDIVTIVIMGCIIIAAGYLALSFLGVFGSKSSKTSSTETTTQTQSSKPEFTGNIDNSTLQKVNNLKDYGQAPLDNIGRVNPFGPLN